MNNKGKFWKGVKQEWRKISWTPREQLVSQCTVVVAASVVIVLLITLIDTGALALIERLVG